MLDFKNLKSVHFIGIGGVSLSSLALFMRARNISVSGSDRVFGDKIPLLAENGCDVWIGVRPEKIKDVQLVVYSGAVPRGNAELLYCKSRGIPCLERCVFLGELSLLFKSTIAIGGTHGKTTVTSMLTHVFLQSRAPFFGHIGGDLKNVGNSCYTGDGYFVTEACEYRRGLLYLRPDIGVVLNAEADHPDTYPTLADVYDAFDEFLDNSRRKGYAVINGDSQYYKLRQAHNEAVTFGFGENNRFRACDLYEHKNGFFGFSIYEYGNPICQIKLPVPGKHNVLNALACFTAAYLALIPVSVIAASLDSFPGVVRRFEKTSVFMGAEVYSDYAHHPSEIKATIAAARSIAAERTRITAIFQPHTYSRTAELYGEFLKCFDGADRLLICKEYPARETPDMGMSAKELFNGVVHSNKRYFENIMEIASYLMNEITPDDLILIIGAGDIDNLCYLLGAERSAQSFISPE